MPAKRTVLKALAALPLMALALTGCSALGAFNALVPKDGGVTVAARDVAYGSEPRQRLDVYRPTGDAAGTVVFLYGGSWNSGSKADYGFAARALASRGYVTVVPDYRLVPEVRYPAFVEDSAKAVAWTARNVAAYGGDPKRLYVVGHSAGAYNAMMVALAPEFLRAEGLPVTTIRAAAGLSGPYDFLPLAVDATRAAFGGTENLERSQPVNVVRSGSGPAILLATGDADETVRPRNTTALAGALKRAGRTVKTIIYPGVDHGGTLLALSRPLRGKAPVLDDLIAFFAAQ